MRGPIAIDVTGRFVATGTGTATVTAMVDDVSATATIEIDTGPCPNDVDVFVDTSAPRQTMIGLEANAQNGSIECPKEAYERYKTELSDRAIAELGIDRVRLEFRGNVEHDEPLYEQFKAGRMTFDAYHERFYETVNDDDDPRHAERGRFHFDEMDNAVEQIVLPLSKRLRQRGRELYVSLCYVNFEPSSTVHADPEEYAEVVAVAFEHLHEKYGIVPDGLEIHLEPDLDHTRDAGQIALAMVAATRRLAEKGWHPDVIAPSTVDMGRAIDFVDRMIRVPGVPEVMTELSFHRYRGASGRNLERLHTRAQQYGLRTGMLEHMGSDHLTLEQDILHGGVSTWTLLGLAFCAGHNGGDYFTADVSDPKNPKLLVPKNVRYLAQYSRDVHRGAVRYETRTDDGLHALAFANPPDGRHDRARWTVVVRADEGRSVRVGPLPNGAYAAYVTTEDRFLRDLGPVRVEDGVATVMLPAAGVLTIAAH